MKYLGKIESVKFGHCGYQGTALGVSFTFTFDDCCGVGTCKSAWDAELIKHTDSCKWTEEDRSNQYAEIMRYVSKLLKDAGCNDFAKLSGKPVELEFDGDGIGGTLKDWRILTEVI